MAVFPKSYADVVQRLRVPIGLVLAAAFVWLSQPVLPTLLLGFPVALAGLAVRAWAAGHLRKNQQLTVSGPYAFVRNPLYIGSMMMIVGFFILLGQSGFVWLFAGAFSLIFLAAVKNEERMLAAQYGAAWTAYAAATPRFIPRRLIATTGKWSLRQWRHNREYQAVAATTLGLLGLQLWQQI